MLVPEPTHQQPAARTSFQNSDIRQAQYTFCHPYNTGHTGVAMKEGTVIRLSVDACHRGRGHRHMLRYGTLMVARMRHAAVQERMQ